MNDNNIRIERAGDMDLVRQMFIEYQDYLNEDLCFQAFEKELAELPGGYAPPRGDLWIATVDGAVAGVIGLRPLDDTACEMKRLYVRNEFRGLGLGRMLAERCVVAARNAGFAIMRLDTLMRLTEAVSLYRSMGFYECEAYYNNPLEGVTYWEKRL